MRWGEGLWELIYRSRTSGPQVKNIFNILSGKAKPALLREEERVSSPILTALAVIFAQLVRVNPNCCLSCPAERCLTLESDPASCGGSPAAAIGIQKLTLLVSNIHQLAEAKALFKTPVFAF